jgi:hypothetical protein
MSDEGVVTLSDEMRDISPPRVTPTAGKGALGTWRFRGLSQTQCWGKQRPIISGLDLHVNRMGKGCI